MLENGCIKAVFSSAIITFVDVHTVYPISFLVIYVPRHLSFLLIILVLTINIPCWKIGALHEDGVFISHRMFCPLVADFNIDFRYWPPLRTVAKQCPFRKILSKSYRTSLLLSPYFLQTNKFARSVTQAQNRFIAGPDPVFWQTWSSPKPWCGWQHFSS